MIGGLRRKVVGLGRAGLDLVVSEVEALLADLGASGKGLLKATLFFGVAAAAAFWALGVFLIVLYQLLLALLPQAWGVWAPVAAAGGVFLFLLLLVWICYHLGRRILRELETPVATVRRHVQDHVDWWQDEILPDGPDRPDRSDRSDRSDRPDRPGRSSEGPPARREGS